MITIRSILLPAMLLWAAPAPAQQADDGRVCSRNNTTEPRRRASIAACTRAIASGRYSGANLAILYINRGVEHGALGRHERAIQDYDQAIRVDPNSALAYRNRGGRYIELGQNERAIQDYDQAIRLDASNPVVYDNRCATLAILGRAAEALWDCERALQLQPGFASALRNLAYAYVRLARWPHALQAYDQALAAGAIDAYAWFGRAIVRARLDDRAGAEADLAEARRRNANIDAEAARVHLTAPVFAATAPAPPFAPTPAGQAAPAGPGPPGAGASDPAARQR